jgi:hypothetical protein
LPTKRRIGLEIGYWLSAISYELCSYPSLLFPFLRSFFFFCGAGRYFIFVVIDIFGFQLLLDAGGVDNDGCLAINRAFVFADAAARTFFFFDDGAFLVVTDDGMVGTLLITDKADFFRVPGNTPCLVDMSDPHLEETFLFNGKRPDGFGGTNPSTKIAELFTVTDTGNEPRCVKASQACLQKSGLKGIIGADLQTFAAARADGNKFLFG